MASGTLSFQKACQRNGRIRYRSKRRRGAKPRRPNRALAGQRSLVVEAAKAVPWTKPEELDVKVSELSFEHFGGNQFEAGFVAAFANGSVRTIPKDTPVAELKKFYNGGK